MKIFFTASTILLSVLINAQQNTGINKENPQYTLDVKGTVRINNTDNINQGAAIPLGWNTETNQVIKLSDDKKKPFYKVSYRIRVNEISEDWIKDLDLGIDGSKYDAFVTQSFLVLDNEAKGINAPPAIMEIISNNGTDDFNKYPVLSDNGTIYYRDLKTGKKGGLVASPNEGSMEGVIRFGRATPTVFVKRDDNNKLLLSADYEASSPIVSTRGEYFVWYITLLVMDRNWVKKSHERVVE